MATENAQPWEKDTALSIPPWAKATNQPLTDNVGNPRKRPALDKDWNVACGYSKERESEYTSNENTELVSTLQMIKNGAQSMGMTLPNSFAAILPYLFNRLLDRPGRNLYQECGYPLAISPMMYRQMYDREGSSARVVELEPNESWKLAPEIYEDEDTEEDTEFEAAITELVDDPVISLMHYLLRIDILSGVGSFGILFLGVDDGLPLDQPIAGISPTAKRIDDKGGITHKLMYLRAFDESQVHIGIWETDPTSPRFGQPNTYLIRFVDYTTVPIGQTVTDSTTHAVHWTRVVHIADNRKSSEVFGVPRMQRVFNRLLDVRKILSSSGEMFWKGGFPGLAAEVRPEYANAEIDSATIKDQMERYQDGLQRYIALAGMTVKSLEPQVADPTKHVDAQYREIAITLGIPYRIFLGSESAQLASSQDNEAWVTRLKGRQDHYLTPKVVRAVVDRLVAIGVLPVPKSGKYFVAWPDLQTPSDDDRANYAQKVAQAIQAYVQSDAFQIMSPKMFFVLVLKFSVEEAIAIEEDMENFEASELAEKIHPPEPVPAPIPVGGKQPANGKQPAKAGV